MLGNCNKRCILLHHFASLISAGKESTCNAGDLGLIPWRRERLPTPVFWPGEFHGLHSYIVHGVAKSWTRLSNFQPHLHLASPQPRVSTLALVHVGKQTQVRLGNIMTPTVHFPSPHSLKTILPPLLKLTVCMPYNPGLHSQVQTQPKCAQMFRSHLQHRIQRCLIRNSYRPEATGTPSNRGNRSAVVCSRPGI